MSILAWHGLAVKLHLAEALSRLATVATCSVHQDKHHDLLNMPSPPLPTPRLHPLPDPLAHAPRVQRPASRSPNCSRHAAASAQARCQLTGRVVLGFRPNPLGGRNPCTVGDHQRLCTTNPRQGTETLSRRRCRLRGSPRAGLAPGHHQRGAAGCGAGLGARGHGGCDGRAGGGFV